MKKNILTAAFSLSLLLAPAVLTTAFATPTTVRVTASDSSGDLSYPALYTESSWMSLAVPLADLGGSVPSDLSLDAGTLDAGTTITLDSVTQIGDMALLQVTVSRADTGASINQLATINVMSGGQVVAALSIPVIGAASND